MRTFTTLICCLYMLAPTFAIAQQDESCDANPRWLLVTVLQSGFWMEDEEGVLKRFPPNDNDQDDSYPEGKLWLVDRCEDVDIHSHTGEPNAPSTTRINISTFSDRGILESVTRLWVKESITEICSSVRDCADATSP